ncbi:ACP S-malonyltransferase [Clostridium sp. C8-1-8]|uniref:ACP S-malonyltransferase n=1 Tax=Clostridium sp. C8-1-8 TaxID=2698831 RepID=UPI001367C689|nr:ACP S-malonyltransferase [Clostridium sp. C8-1-8]
MKTYGFPGQGSQYKGIGKDLFDEFSEYVKIPDGVLNSSIKDLWFNDEGNKLSNTKYTQVKIYFFL